jgi:hypothetical protein
MGERFWVTLSIGGDCTPEVRDELARLIEEQGPEDGFDPDEEDLTGPDTDGVISVQFPECNYADLGALEVFLKEHRLPYHKIVDGKSGFDTIILWPLYDRDDDIMGDCYADTDHRPLINGLRVLEMLQDPYTPRADITKWVTDQLPPFLPSFRVIPKETDNADAV